MQAPRWVLIWRSQGKKKKKAAAVVQLDGSVLTWHGPGFQRPVVYMGRDKKVKRPAELLRVAFSKWQMSDVRCHTATGHRAAFCVVLVLFLIPNPPHSPLGGTAGAAFESQIVALPCTGALWGTCPANLVF
jgi:hypothetical protein